MIQALFIVFIVLIALIILFLYLHRQICEDKKEKRVGFHISYLALTCLLVGMGIYETHAEKPNEFVENAEKLREKTISLYREPSRPVTKTGGTQEIDFKKSPEFIKIIGLKPRPLGRLWFVVTGRRV